METPEKRRFVRYDVQAEVRLEFHGQVHHCRTDDLGAGGCRIDVPWAMDRGVVVQLALGSGAEVVQGAATVAWTNKAVPCRVGLAFSDALAEHAVVLIQRLLGSVRLGTGDPA